MYYFLSYGEENQQPPLANENTSSHKAGLEGLISTSFCPQNSCSKHFEISSQNKLPNYAGPVEEARRWTYLFVLSFSLYYVTCKCYLHHSNLSARTANLYPIHSDQMQAKDGITAYVSLETLMKEPSFLHLWI